MINHFIGIFFFMYFQNCIRLITSIPNVHVSIYPFQISADTLTNRRDYPFLPPTLTLPRMSPEVGKTIRNRYTTRVTKKSGNMYRIY